MGKWNHRPRRNYTGNKKYRDYADYEQPPPSPPSPHHSQSNPPAIEDNNELPWEIDFCKSVGVRWKKVLAAKNYMYCHDNIVKWDDSAAKESFLSAKQRYWEKINRLPTEIPLEDPNKYIGEIDWNSKNDPGLLSELDRAYFNPDEVGMRGKFYRRDTRRDPGCDVVQSHESFQTGQNKWESSPTVDIGLLKDGSTSWGHNAKSISGKDDGNPWEQSCITVNEASKNDLWKGCADESWDCKQKQTNNGQSSNWNGGCQYTGHVGENVRTYTDDRSSNWKKGDTYSHLQQHTDYTGNSWQHSSAPRINAAWNRERKEMNKSWNSNRPGVQKMANNHDFQESSGGGNTFQSGYRKREGSFQHPQRYKSSRFQGNDYGVVNEWNTGNPRERVSFDSRGKGNW